MRRSTRLEPISAPSSKTSIIEAGCIQRSATNPRLSSKPNSANSKPSERTQPRLCHSNPVSQPRGAVQFTVPDLISAEGGITKFAHLLSLPVQTVAAWKARGSIHRRHWPLILAKCPDLTPSTLLDVHAGHEPDLGFAEARRALRGDEATAAASSRSA